MPGETISHYRIVEKLGEGGMGEVYLAEDTLLDRKVALKFLSRELESDEMARRRLLREAKSAAAIDHPYSCKIYEVGRAEGKDFIAMEYVDGRTLADVLRGGPLSVGTAVNIAGEIAEALEKAHESDIVHRDLKPSNVMLTDEGHVKVMDFGLAKPKAPRSGVDDEEATLTALTQLGSTPGTPAYMSPEQVRGQEADQRSDVFSFGILLYEMLAGRHPFLRAGAPETLAAILAEDVPPIGRPEVPEPLDRLVVKCLHKSPEERHGGFGELRRELTEAESSMAPRVVSRRRRPKTMMVGIIVAGAVLIGLFAWQFSGRSAEQGPPDVESLQLSDYEARARYLMQNFSNPDDLALSIEMWGKLRELRPDSAAALAGMAAGHALVAWNSKPDPNLLELAESQAREAIELDPEQAVAYVALAIIYQLRGLQDTAASMSERSVELAPDSPWVLQNRARFLMDQYGDFASAEALARRATEIDPDHTPAWFQLGWAQFELEQTGDAEQSFRRSISSRPDFGAGYMGLGLVLASRGEFAEARLSLDEALEIDPNSMQSLFLRGVTDHYAADPAGALESFRSVTERNPEHILAAYALLYQAVEHDTLGMPTERDQALSAAEKAFKAFPQMAWSLKGLAGVAAARGDREGAFAWLHRAQGAGLFSVHQLLLDPALESLQDDPRYRKLIEDTRLSRR